MAEIGTDTPGAPELKRRRILEGQERLRNIERQKLLDTMQPNADDRIFDVGCSTGRLLKQLDSEFHVAEAHGSDVDPKLGQPDKGIIVASGENLEGVPDGHYTKVVFSHSLEHIPNRPAALQEAYRILGDEGRIYVTFFLYTEESRRLPGVAQCFDSPAPIVDPAQIRAELEQAGFQILSDQVLTELSSATVQLSEVPSLMIEAEKIPMTTNY